MIEENIIKKTVAKADVRLDSEPPVYSLKELVSATPQVPRWVVHEKLRCGSYSILGGQPKAGKSTLTRCLAASVATSKPWLGWKTMPGPVLYLAMEEDREEVARHLAILTGTSDALCPRAPVRDVR
jgi:RecA-family ATPase